MTRRTRGRLAVLAIVAFGAANPVSAADIAAFSPLGFSPDGKVFAFEQYGIQDGSGFPYSEIFAIDTDKDAFLPGTPVRVRIDSEEAGLSVARSKAAAEATPRLSNYTLTDQPGQLVAFNPVSELDTAPHELGYRAFPAEPAFGEPFRLTLTESDRTSPENCKDIVETVKGFRLFLSEKDGEPTQTVLHEDPESIPASRRCPTGYRLGGVMTFHPMQGEPVHVALVLVLSFGFEGRDGRWIAVPYRP